MQDFNDIIDPELEGAVGGLDPVGGLDLWVPVDDNALDTGTWEEFPPLGHNNKKCSKADKNLKDGKYC